MITPSYKFVSDCGLLVEFATETDDEVNKQVIHLDRCIAKANIAGIKEVVPALVNLLIIFDTLETDHVSVQRAIEALFPLDSLTEDAITEHVINVCFDDEFAPDLPEVAKARGMDNEDVINTHCRASYRVSMYGFAPGYAYLSGVPEAIQVPRKKTPVRDIPAGTVMIAGSMCLITTVKMPTGWSLIGHSDAEIMTGRADQAFLFNVGDTVSFKRVSRDELKRLPS